eukprot:5969652-Ditylum_brightwellii.AAC.1
MLYIRQSLMILHDGGVDGGELVSGSSVVSAKRWRDDPWKDTTNICQEMERGSLEGQYEGKNDYKFEIPPQKDEK